VTFAFDAYPVEVASDPFPIYRTMCDEDPEVWCDPTQAWALSRYDDVLTAMRDTDPFSSAYGNIVNDNPARARRKLGTTDPPRHEQLPKLVDAVFARRAVDQYEPPIGMLGESLLKDAVADGGVVALHSAIAFGSTRSLSVMCSASTSPDTGSWRQRPRSCSSRFPRTARRGSSRRPRCG
jgi:hypothetical protein